MNPKWTCIKVDFFNVLIHYCLRIKLFLLAYQLQFIFCIIIKFMSNYLFKWNIFKFIFLITLFFFFFKFLSPILKLEPYYYCIWYTNEIHKVAKTWIFRMRYDLNLSKEYLMEWPMLAMKPLTHKSQHVSPEMCGLIFFEQVSLGRCSIK